jgi:hypothetical protein
MAWVPVEGTVMVAVAVVPPPSVLVATVLPSSVKVTVPVAVMELVLLDANVAVTNMLELAMGVVVAGVTVSVVVALFTMMPTAAEVAL